MSPADAETIAGAEPLSGIAVVSERVAATVHVVALASGIAGSRAKAGTLEAAIQQHLGTLPRKSARRNNAAWNLEPWQEQFGALKLKDVTAVMISRTLSAWRADGYAPSTIDHRRQELSNVFTTANGRSGANPVRDTPIRRGSRGLRRTARLSTARRAFYFEADAGWSA